MAKDPVLAGPVDLQLQEPVSRPETAPDPELVVAEVPSNAWVVILAGGQGTRIAEETQGLIPKPMLEVGGTPMLEHIMRIYSAQGLRRFIIATGHLGEAIQEWASVGMASGTVSEFADEVIVEDTGLDTQTGGRLLRLRERLQYAPFMLTYGDGFADINFKMLVDHHRTLRQPGRKHSTITLSAVHPPARFGNLVIENGSAIMFGEKTQSPLDWINGGFYIVEPTIFNLLTGDDCRLEYDVLPSLAIQRRVGAYQHPSFFQMCDTARDLQLLNQMWETGNAPWKRW